MKKITLSERLRYRFDNIMARGTLALLVLLFVLSALFILTLALVVHFGGFDVREDGSHIGLPGLVWMMLLRTLDSGTMGGDTGTDTFLGVMLLVTFGGIFLVSTLIGVISNGIQTRIEELRKGRSFVVETEHTLILGWSPAIFSVIAELAAANVNQRKCIVILADQDKVEMEDALRARVPHLGKTRVVCRTGSPMSSADLDIVNPNAARAIIILAPESDDPDSEVLKTILAVMTNPIHRATPYHIVAEGRDAENVPLAQMVGQDQVQFVVASDLISRITAQTCRQSGLSLVYTELLTFDGDEIYFQREPTLADKTFADALLMYEDSAVLGLLRADGTVCLNPPMDTRIAAEDLVIAVSRDDDTIRLSGKIEYGIDADAIQPGQAHSLQPERALILGWNQRGAKVIRELDNYVAPGSEIMIVADAAELERALAGIHTELHNLTATFRHDDTTDRRVLDALNLPLYDHVIVLSYSDQLDAQRADARTLVTLLHLRDVREKTDGDFSIVSEMLDVRNRDLAHVTRADDFIVSDKLVSLLLAQLAENPKLADVFADLFDPSGTEIYLKPARNYVELGRPLNFYTVVHAARMRGEIAIGYRLRAWANDPTQVYGVRVNPNKAEQVTFASGDRVIVLAGN